MTDDEIQTFTASFASVEVTDPSRPESESVDATFASVEVLN